MQAVTTQGDGSGGAFNSYEFHPDSTGTIRNKYHNHLLAAGAKTFLMPPAINGKTIFIVDGGGGGCLLNRSGANQFNFQGVLSSSFPITTLSSVECLAYLGVWYVCPRYIKLVAGTAAFNRVGGVPETLTLAAAGTWYPVITFDAECTEGGVMLVADAVNGDYLMVPVGSPVKFDVDFSTAFEGTPGNLDIEMGVFLNDEVQPSILSTARSLSTAGKIGSVTDLHCSTTLVGGDKLRTKFRAVSGTPTLSLHEVTTRLRSWI